MKTDFKPYPKYRDSGVKWLGNIPEHWEIKKLKHLVIFIKNGTTTPQMNYETPYKVTRIETISSGKINYKKVGYAEMSLILKKFQLEKYDILLSHINSLEMVGNSAIFLKEEELYSGMNLLRIQTKKDMDPFYLLWCLKSKFFIYTIRSIAKHAINQVSVTISDLKDIMLPSTQIDEQKAIANFLDKETTHIDSLIQKKQKQIELLKEKRSALITQAVTKGLDPNIKMKDSGVEWLGEIPEHWKLTRLKFLLSEPLKYGANESAEYDEPLWPRYIRITDIDENGLLRDDTFKSIPKEIAHPYLLKDGDILFARSGATVGKTFIYKDSWGQAAFAGYLIRGRFERKKALEKFIYYFSKSRIYWEWIKNSFIQATIQNVSAEKYSNLFVPLSQVSEQKAIANFLDKETTRIDSLMEKIKRSIELLKEYRSALITAVVTGKINVCDLPEEKVVNINQFQKKKKETPPLFKKTVLGAEIVAQMKDSPHFGRTKFMKTLYLCEAHLGIPLKGEYKREAAGPLDHSIYKMEGIMKKNKWFDVVKKESMFKYKALEKSEGYKHYFNKYWKDYSEQLNQLLLLVNRFTTEQSEIVDTIYAVWNDFLMEGKKPSDNEIICEIKNNWHESKKRFSDEKLKKAMKWMKEQNLVPQGHGPKTKGE